MPIDKIPKYLPPGRRKEEKVNETNPNDKKKSNTFMSPRYKAPHKNTSKVKAIDLSITEKSFPKLEQDPQEDKTQNKAQDKTQEDNSKDWGYGNPQEDNSKDQNHTSKQDQKQINKTEPGWVTITKNKDTNKIRFTYGPPKQNKDQNIGPMLTPYRVIDKFKSPYVTNTIPYMDTEIETQTQAPTLAQINNMYKNMCKRYEKYNDEINELLGDRSPHINYKSEIEEMVAEENEIQEEMNYYKNRNKDNISDDEDDDEYKNYQTDEW